MKQPNDIKRPNPSTPPLGRLFRMRGIFIPLPGVKYGKGRNGEKRARRAAEKEARRERR